MTDTTDHRPFIPGREPAPDGNAMPLGPSSEAEAQRLELRDQVRRTTMPPVGASHAQAEAAVDERLRTMTIVGRVFAEVGLAQRRRASHSFDYDSLAHGLPAHADPTAGGGDNWGDGSLPAPAPSRPRGRGWY